MNWIQKIGARLLGISLKKTTPIHVSHSGHNQEVFFDWSEEKAVEEGFKKSVWVYGSVRELSTPFASVPMKLQKRSGQNWKDVPDHPLQMLLDKPNEFISRQDLATRWCQHMSLSGNALFWLNIANNEVLEIWPIRPDEIKPIYSKSEFIGGYKFVGPDGIERILQRIEVIHWQYPDPSNPRWGMSPLEAAACAVDMDKAAANWNRKMLQNDGKPSIAVMLSDKLSMDQMKEASSRIRDQIDGGKVRQALILSGATSAMPLSLSATELDFLNGRKFSKEEIAASFGVPPILLTVGDGATYANLDAAERILWESRIVPLANKYAEGLQIALFPFYGLDMAKYRIAPDLENIRPLQSNLQTEANVMKTRTESFKNLVGAGVPANQAAEECGLGLKDIPDGDKPQKPPAPVPPKEKEPEEEGDEEATKSEPDELKKMLARREKWTREIKKRVAKLLIKQGNAIAAAYVSGSPWEKDLRLSDWGELLKAMHQAVFESEGKILYGELLNSIKIGGGGSFDVLADNVVDWIEENSAEKIAGITETSKALISKTIVEAVEEGETAELVAKRIRKLHKGWSEARATTIARTEVNTSFNAAHHITAEQLEENNDDLELEKQWISIADNRRRKEHEEMDGEIVALNEVFSNGLPYPSEPNCRCTILFAEKVTA